MIHVNVQHDRELADGAWIVETSTDGAGWKKQYLIPAKGEGAKDARGRAEDCARIFVNGARYAGATVRMTIESWPTAS